MGYCKDRKGLAVCLRWSIGEEGQVMGEGSHCFLGTSTVPATPSASPENDAEVGPVFLQTKGLSPKKAFAIKKD